MPPKIPAVVLAKAVPEAAQIAACRLDVGARCLAAVLRVFDHPCPSLGREAEACEQQKIRSDEDIAADTGHFASG